MIWRGILTLILTGELICTFKKLIFDHFPRRIGRTARGGEKGTAYTFVTDKDKEMVGHLVRNLEGANQYVPDDLMSLAMQSSWFRKSRFAGGKGKAIGGGAGLGFRERPEQNKSSAGSSGYMPSFNNAKPTSSQPTNRLETLKNAFKSQYASQFKTSTDRSWETEIIPPAGVFAKPSLPPPTANSNSSSSEDQSKKKKSRWT